MDPDATLARLINAAVAGDHIEFHYAQRDLMEWLEHGGFPPQDPRKTAYKEGVSQGYAEGIASTPGGVYGEPQ